MAKRRGQPVHGWVNLDKPRGISSAKAVAIVRRVFDAAKAGHGGTLDPLASGVLPIALGEATKTVSYTMGKSKSYEFSLAWGSETSTDDTEGEVTRQSDRRPSDDDIDRALTQFQGVIDQVPPDYSAIKIEGTRAYDLARRAGAGQPLPALKPRQVHIDEFRRLDSDQTDHLGLDTITEMVIRSLLLLLTLVLNSAMITVYTKSLSLAQVAAEASLLNTASNMLVTASLSYFIFSELLSLQWVLGAGLVLIGMTKLLFEDDDRPHEKDS